MFSHISTFDFFFLAMIASVAVPFVIIFLVNFIKCIMTKNNSKEMAVRNKY